MNFLNVTLDTQCVAACDLKALLRNGQVLHASGTINLRWEEFSALNLVQGAGLTDVAWEAVSDDTPGSLELTILYPELGEDRIRRRLAETSGIEEYEIQSKLQSTTEM